MALSTVAVMTAVRSQPVARCVCSTLWRGATTAVSLSTGCPQRVLNTLARCDHRGDASEHSGPLDQSDEYSEPMASGKSTSERVRHEAASVEFGTHGVAKASKCGTGWAGRRPLSKPTARCP
jgi:hypothetical protein